MQFLSVIAGVGYFALGFFQLFAVYAGLSDWVGLHWIIAGPLAFFISYMPLIGTVVGMFGAVESWGWSWIQAFALFFGPFIVISVAYMLASTADR